MMPAWKVSHSNGATHAEELVTYVRDSDIQQVQLVPFSRASYTVVRMANDSDTDRLLSFDDDPGFDRELIPYVRHTCDT